MGIKLRYIIVFALVVALGTWLYVHRTVQLDKVPVILGHGGMGVRSPYTLNSERSLEVAFTYPIDGTEIDVRMTADNVLIAYHDEEFPVYSGCPGAIWTKTYEQVYACSHGVFHQENPIPALDTLLANCAAPKGSIFSLDLKPNVDSDSSEFAQYRAQVDALIEQFSEYNFFIESQDLDLLVALKEMDIRAQLFYYAQSGESGIENVKKHQLDGISINAALINEQQILEAQQAKIKVMIWGTGSVFSNRKFLTLNADIIQTDAIKSMMRILGK